MKTQNAPTQPAAHTPVPWKAARSNEDFDGPLYDLDDEEELPPFKRIYGASGHTVISCHDLAAIRPEDAELIVKAVNSHAALVAINAEMVAALEKMTANFAGSTHVHHAQKAKDKGQSVTKAMIRWLDELAEARAVLARAEAMKKEGGL